MKKILLLILAVVVSGGAGKGAGRWIDKAKGKYDLSENKAERYFQMLSPSVTIDTRQKSIKINRYGDFDISTAYGEKIYLSLMARDIPKSGKWALYRMDYISDRSQRKITKFVGVAVKGRRDKIVFGPAFDYPSEPSNPKNGITIMKSRN